MILPTCSAIERPAEKKNITLKQKQTNIHNILSNRCHPIFTWIINVNCAATVKTTNCYSFLYTLSAKQIWAQNRIPHSLDFELYTRVLPHNLCLSLTILTFNLAFNFVNRGFTFDHWSFESHYFSLLVTGLPKLEHQCASYLVNFVWSVHDILLDAFTKICGVMNLFGSLERKIEFHLKQFKNHLLFSADDNRFFANHRKTRRVFDYIPATQTSICWVCQISRLQGAWLITVTSHNSQLKLSTQMSYQKGSKL